MSTTDLEKIRPDATPIDATAGPYLIAAEQVYKTSQEPHHAGRLVSDRIDFRLKEGEPFACCSASRIPSCRWIESVSDRLHLLKIMNHRVASPMTKSEMAPRLRSAPLWAWRRSSQRNRRVSTN
jgi:hypothetical protein